MTPPLVLIEADTKNRNNILNSHLFGGFACTDQ